MMDNEYLDEIVWNNSVAWFEYRFLDFDGSSAFDCCFDECSFLEDETKEKVKKEIL